MDEYSFATVDEYRIDTGDTATPDERVAAELSRQSAKLRATLGMGRTRTLTGGRGGAGAGPRDRRGTQEARAAGLRAHGRG